MPERPTIEREPSDPFKEWLRDELPKQYKQEAQTLHNLGLLDLLVKETPEGAKGIVGIDKREYPFPRLKDIEQEIKENEDIYRQKIEQGFGKLQITPFALPLDVLIQTLERTLIEHHKKEKLFATRKNPNEEQFPLELDENQPVWT